jgi:lysophospholipid acyltransferase (LPLAT)-like uncharacterized protein
MMGPSASSSMSFAPLDWRSRGLVLAATAVLRGLKPTWRIRRVVSDPGLVPGFDRRPRLYAFWHAQMIPAMLAHEGSGIAVLISGHRDGELIARLAARFGIRAIRGSTSRGAAGALRAIERALSDGLQVAVTPDGPRGPAEVFAPGTLIAAQRVGVPVVLGGIVPTRAWRLETWDRFIVPKPFGEIVASYTDELTVDAKTPRLAAGAAAQFQERLRAINRTLPNG